MRAQKTIEVTPNPSVHFMYAVQVATLDTLNGETIRIIREDRCLPIDAERIVKRLEGKGYTRA